MDEDRCMHGNRKVHIEDALDIAMLADNDAVPGVA